MNAVDGKIVSFVENDGVSLVSISTALGEFSVLMLGFSQSLKAKKDSKVELLFKENELFLAKIPTNAKNVSSTKNVFDTENIACENAFKSVVKSIDKGELLWQVFLENLELSALITAKVGKHLDLKPRDAVLCFVKPSDIIIKVL